MKQALLIAGAAALIASVPAAAKPGNGHGNGHGYGYGNVERGMVHSNQGLGTTYGYGQGGCPPGLAKKAIPCVPPGQAKKYALGQQVALNQALMGYSQLPYGVRSAYGPQLNPYGRYMMNNGYVYGVDPQTMIVNQVLSRVLNRR